MTYKLICYSTLGLLLTLPSLPALAGPGSAALQGRSLQSGSGAPPTNQWILDYSTFLGGRGFLYSEQSGYGIATDSAGNIIVAGYTDQPDSFPIAHWFGPTNAIRGAFITKVDPAGQHLLGSAFLAWARARSVVLDAQGNIYVAGECESVFAPTNTVATNVLQAATGGGLDAFVAKLNPAATQLLYATFLGGNDDDLAWSLAVDAQGQAYLTGWTTSTNFPVTANALQPALGGNADAFLAIVNSTGSALTYATYLGGDQQDFGSALALDQAGNLYLGGHTQSANLTSKVTPQRLGTHGWRDAFVAKFKPGGTALHYLTLMGGAGSQSAVAALNVDTNGQVYVLGNTDATNFPVTANCWQAVNHGGMDNFVAKLNATGSAFVYATYLGGSNSEDNSIITYVNGDVPLEKGGLVVDSAGNAYVAGLTASTDLAPAGLAANIFGGYNDGYVAQIDPTGSRLLALAYLGGMHPDTATALTLDNQGRVLVTGAAGPSPGAPYFSITANAWQLTNGSPSDVFITRLRAVQGPPANDAFANRTRLAGPRVTAFENNSAASKEPGEPNHAGNAGGNSLWWSWTPAATGRLTVTTAGSTFETLLAVYTNATLAQLGTVAANDALPGQDNVVVFPVSAGTEYQIAVDGRDGASGAILLSLTLSVPPNDDFTNRIRITNFPATITGSNVDATGEPDEPRDLSGRTVWWEWVAPISGPVSLDTVGSSLDTLLAVYTNTTLANLGLVALNQAYTDTNGNWGSHVDLQAVAGTAYQIAIDGGYNLSTGPIVLHISPGAPPANDNFTNSVRLTGALTNLTGNNYGATREPGEPSIWSDAANHTVWWSWQAPADGRVTITTEGSYLTVGNAMETRLAVFTGTSLSNLTLVAWNARQIVPYTDYFDRYNSRVNFPVQANTLYQIQVDASGSNSEGTILLSLHFYNPFTILSSSLVRPTAAGFQFSGQGYPGATYVVEASTDLVNWQRTTNVSLTGPSFVWRDTNALSFPHRFYRLVEQTPGP